MSAAQLELDLAELVTPEYPRNASIQERYEAWAAVNPWVLGTLERLIAEWLDAGHKRVGLKQVWEVLRWQYGTTTGDRFKANNDFTSRAARTVLQRHPEWRAAIEIRGLRRA